MGRPRKFNAVVLKGNSELAKKHVENVENVFIKNINAVSLSIMKLEIGKVTKDMIVDVITDGGIVFNDARNTYFGDTSGNDSLLESTREAAFNNLWDGVIKATSPFKESTCTIFNGMRINNPTLFDWFDIDENGMAFLLDSKKEEIIDEVREYITTQEGVMLYNLQHEIVEKMQQMFDTMQAITERKDVALSDAARGVYSWDVRCLWSTKTIDTKDDDGNIISTRTVFTPNCINFDPVKPDDDDIIDDDE